MQIPRPISRQTSQNHKSVTPQIPRWPFFSVVLAIAVAAATLSLPTKTSAEVVIELTQTPCTIVEAELKPRAFTSTKSDDCIRINRKTEGEREFKELRLKPGRTIFRVMNKDVPYELGFWVRGKGFGKLTLPTVSGGGLMEGETKDYVIDLTAGEYLYSCPLNPTPNYPLIVE